MAALNGWRTARIMTQPSELQGKRAPDFTAPTDTTGEQLTLSALRGQMVVLFFYPKDDTSG